MAANVADISAAKPLIAQAPKMPLLLIVYAQERLTGICIKPEICSSAFNWIKHFRCVATRFKTLDLHDATIVRSPEFVMPRLIGHTTWYSCPFHPVRRNFYWLYTGSCLAHGFSRLFAFSEKYRSSLWPRW